MNTDRYTKFILTVIAVALVANLFKEVTQVDIVSISGNPLRDSVQKPLSYLPVVNVDRK